jgi:dTDP-D-glucose 4,6-dehydratase
VDRLIADASKVQERCSWAPAVSLEEGLRRTIDWIAAHPSFYRPHVYGV